MIKNLIKFIIANKTIAIGVAATIITCGVCTGIYFAFQSSSDTDEVTATTSKDTVDFSTATDTVDFATRTSTTTTIDIATGTMNQATAPAPNEQPSNSNKNNSNNTQNSTQNSTTNNSKNSSNNVTGNSTNNTQNNTTSNSNTQSQKTYTAGIDWNLTNGVESSLCKVNNTYTGIKQDTVYNYAQMIANSKISESQAIKELNAMTWQESGSVYGCDSQKYTFNFYGTQVSLVSILNPSATVSDIGSQKYGSIRLFDYQRGCVYRNTDGTMKVVIVSTGITYTRQN